MPQVTTLPLLLDNASITALILLVPSVLFIERVSRADVLAKVGA